MVLATSKWSRCLLDRRRLIHSSDSLSKERASFKPMKKNLTHSPHAKDVPPKTSPSGSIDQSKASSNPQPTMPDLSAIRNPNSNSNPNAVSVLDTASLVRSGSYHTSKRSKPEYLRRPRGDKSRPDEAIDETRAIPGGDVAAKDTQRPRDSITGGSQHSEASAEPQVPDLQLGGLAPNSIFAEEAGWAESDIAAPEEDPAAGSSREVSVEQVTGQQMVLNPRPHARALWHRRMVIRSVRHRGRLSKEQTILRTERFSLSKSHFFKTSIKKLVPLARQIASKTIDEAVLQMRFSKKKAARDVLDHLRHAKDQAIVQKGMGLGLETPADLAKRHPNPSKIRSPSASASASASKKEEVALMPSATILSPRQARPQPDEPQPLSNADPSRIYISQAWVNRGPYDKEAEFRAFGRTNLLRPPHTGISVLLKEERTRLREQREKEQKAERKRRKVARGGDGGMWTAMPDRKITTSGNHVLW